MECTSYICKSVNPTAKLQIIHYRELHSISNLSYEYKYLKLNGIVMKKGYSNCTPVYGFEVAWTGLDDCNFIPVSSQSYENKFSDK